MMLRIIAVALGCFLIAACADPREPPPSPARQALAEIAREGPVLALIYGQPFALDEATRDALVTEELARGIQGLQASFTTDPARAVTTDPRLVVVLNPVGDPAASLACTEPDRIATAPSQGELAVLAVFCRGDEPLGVAREQAAAGDLASRPPRRMLWRTAAQVFPDDYWQGYGFDIIPGIDIGVGGTFGF